MNIPDVMKLFKFSDVDINNENIYDDMRTIIKHINYYIDTNAVVPTIKLFDSFINHFDIFINLPHCELTKRMNMAVK
jgi:hypothetical protein